MAEEQRDAACRRQHDDAARIAVAPGDPGSGKQQGQADGGDEVQEPKQHGRIVGDEAGREWPEGEAAKHRAAVGDRADDRQQQDDTR